MERRELLKQLSLMLPASVLAKYAGAISLLPAKDDANNLSGPFKPNWQSLAQYKTPDWFRNAKFGIWAHWGPQCQPEFGDWYAREMYMEGHPKYKYHLEKYGHPSQFGFKDVINEWKAENWNPEELVSLYKNAGAKYFMALANHHDNFDLYNSKYHQWNSLKIGPKKDLIGGWEKAARNNGLHFGVSVHAAHAWSWYETAQRADKEGKYAGIPYDGKLTKQQGKGKWWEGLNPQELYVQNHSLSANSEDNNGLHKQWDWGNGVSIPSKDYCKKFLNRTIDLIDKYNPDLVYFDDTALPLWPVSDAGLKIAAHFYNKSIKEKGSLQAVLFGKVLDEQQRKCMVWDIERGQSNNTEPLPWQTDTCIGSWHYNKTIFDNHKYKSAKTVIHTLVDVVSKNGNLCLSVPVKGDGTIDSDERKIVEGVGAWMKINSECIYDTRPWKIFGEGPALEKVAALSAQGFNEGKGKPFTNEDVRFTVKGNILYAVFLGWPDQPQQIVRAITTANSVELLGYGKLEFAAGAAGLKVSLPQQPPCENAFVLKITGAV
jgi:alpha-L-fucosidase